MNEAKLTFEQWIDEVDAFVTRKVGLALHTLSDRDYRAFYDAGDTPEDCYEFHLREEADTLCFEPPV